jgi:hypothetical protein
MGIEHLKAHQFKKGQIANPKGRPARKGRQAMLEAMEVWLFENRDKFMKRLSQEAFKKPIAFTRDILIPMFPREMLLEFKDGEGKSVMWRCLTEIGVSDTKAQAILAPAPTIDIEDAEVLDVRSP